MSGAPETIPRSALGAPEYFARHPAPAHPRDLAAHECLNWRPASDQAPYAWEFTENGHDFAVASEARVLTNYPALNLPLALAGVGLALAREDVVRPYIERGEFISVLEEFSTSFPGFYLYYPAPPSLPRPPRPHRLPARDAAGAVKGLYRLRARRSRELLVPHR